MKRGLMLFCALVLSGCADEQDDIQSWMDQESSTMKGVVKPLPEIKVFTPVSYAAADLVDPFSPGRIEPVKKSDGSGGPPPNWIQEPLEAYPLESLEMVGMLAQNGAKHALIRVGKSLYQVKVGNHMGQNYGVITSIDETEVTLKEIVQDMSGDWVERTSTLLLQERQGGQK